MEQQYHCFAGIPFLGLPVKLERFLSHQRQITVYHSAQWEIDLSWAVECPAVAIGVMVGEVMVVN